MRLIDAEPLIKNISAMKTQLGYDAITIDGIIKALKADAIVGLCCDCLHGGPCCDYSENESCSYRREDGSCWVPYSSAKLDRSRWKGCDYCNANIYVKVKKYLRPLLAAATYVGELRDKLEDLTGGAYVGVPKKYCPICGRPLTEEAWAELERRLKNEP